MRIDRDHLARVLQELVRIDSINPAFGGPGERAIAAHVAGALERLGLEVTACEATGGRPSIVGRLRGSGGGRSLMLYAHMDTVAVTGMQEPFSGAVRAGKLYGRGAYDMKAGLAASLGAVKALNDAAVRLRGDVVIAAVADEEAASIGMQEVLARVRTDAAIVTEPTELRLCMAHKGFSWIEIETLGRAAHGSRFDLGVDANLHMGRVLARLERLERELRESAPHPLCGPPSLHAATLRGGTGWSTYAPSCVLQVERRMLPGETEAQALAPIEQIVKELAQSDGTFQARVRATLTRPGYEARADSEIVAIVAAAAREVLGEEPERFGMAAWLDAALIAAAGIDTAIIGAAGAGAHADEEWADIESVIQLARVLAAAARAYCGEGA